MASLVSRRLTQTLMCSLLLLCSICCLAPWARAEQKNPYLQRTINVDGQLVDEIVVPGGRPVGPLPVAVSLPAPNITAGVNTLSNVPAFDWSYGCAATAAAMMVGYYDRKGFPNMYTGPTNGGVCPLDNAAWGAGECPLSATHLGKDNRTTRGHVDDYYIELNSTKQDPYITNGWTEHTPADCTGDFMGTNQSKVKNNDGATILFFNQNSTPCYDYTASEPAYRDGCHGLKLFVQSRGYTVETNYSQYIKGYKTLSGFTFQEFQAEINAGRPVLIHLEGHTMLGVGYDDASQLIYIHDTWDYKAHSMTWGGSYSGMKHMGVTVFRLSSEPIPLLQSDLLIRGATGSSVGDNIYNTTGENQKVEQSIAPGAKATYVVKIQNDGNKTDAITVTGPAGDANWNVKYFSAATGGTDITQQVAGSGWSANGLAANGAVEMRVEVTADAKLTDGSKELLIKGVSTGDTSKVDAVLAVTTVKPPVTYKPDFQIKGEGDTEYIGNNVYGTTDPLLQRKDINKPVNVPAIFQLKIQNDGTGPDTFAIVPCSQAPNSVIKFFDALTGGNEITTTVLASQWISRQLAPGDAVELRMEVTYSIPCNYGASLQIISKGSTGANIADRVDFGGSITGEDETSYKPDLLIKSGETAIGDGVYNVTGENQRVDQTVPRGSKATYVITVQNDGTKADTVKLTGPAGSGDWTVKYFDAATEGTEITGAITGTGWTTPSLAVGSAKDIRVEIIPGATVTEGASLGVLVKGASTGSSNKVDAVVLNIRLLTPPSPYQPDVLIRTSTETEFIGNNVYNLTDSQTTRLSVAALAAAVYHLRVQNDGTQNDKFTLTLGDAQVGWTVKVFDALTGGTNITDAVRGNGWTTASLAPNAVRDLRLEIMPGSNVVPGTQYRLPVTAVSLGNTTKSDTVMTETTCQSGWVPTLRLIASPATTGIMKQPVTLTALWNGGGTMEFKFFVYTGGNWVPIRSYSTANTCTWTPTTAGTVNLLVWARPLGSKQEWTNNATIWSYTVKASLSKVTLAVTPGSPQKAGTLVTLAATPTGGSTVEYYFQYSDGKSGWKVIRAYGTASTCTWTLPAAGTYSLLVWAREKGSKNTYDVTATVWNYVVTPK